MPGRTTGRHRFGVGFAPKPYIKYGYTSASHVPGHYVNKFGKNVYMPQRKSRGFQRTGGYYGRYNNPTPGNELKFHDTTSDDAVVASGGIINNSINLIAQGVSEKQRIGRKCTVVSIFAKITITLPTISSNAAIGVGDIVRIILYQDKQANGANVGGLTQILEVAEYDSFRNLANSKRFVILKDKTYTLNRLVAASDTTTTIDSSQVLRFVTMSRTGLNIPIEFDSTTGAITEIRSNNLAFLYISLNGLVGITNVVRVRFKG